MPENVLPRLRFAAPWSSEERHWSSTGGRLLLRRIAGPSVAVEVQRCVSGRLRNSYPVAAHDIEVRVSDAESSEALTEVLVAVVRAVRAADPDCRKVVYAVDRGPQPRARATVSAAEAAGFRYVVDVDITDAELSLLVSEPDWVTRVDMYLDRVPGS